MSHGVLSYSSAFRNLFTENEKHLLIPYKGQKCRFDRSAACETRLICTLSENLIPSRIHRIRQHGFKGNSVKAVVRCRRFLRRLLALAMLFDAILTWPTDDFIFKIFLVKNLTNYRLTIFLYFFSLTGCFYWLI